MDKYWLIKNDKKLIIIAIILIPLFKSILLLTLHHRFDSLIIDEDNDYYYYDISQFFVLANQIMEQKRKPIIITVLNAVLNGTYDYYLLSLKLFQVLLPRSIDFSQVNSYSSLLILHFPGELQKNKVFTIKTKNVLASTYEVTLDSSSA